MAQRAGECSGRNRGTWSLDLDLGNCEKAPEPKSPSPRSTTGLCLLSAPLRGALPTHASLVLLSPQKKSRNETYGEGSGVEILENRPYTDGPGGSGQYTHKVYHVGMHIPGWFRSILPKAALRVVEESWNAYPYTRTRCVPTVCHLWAEARWH